MAWHDSDTGAVEAAARVFRRALELGGLRSISFKDFPRGSCADCRATRGVPPRVRGSESGRPSRHSVGTTAVESSRTRGSRAVGCLSTSPLINSATSSIPVIVTRRSEWHDNWQIARTSASPGLPTSPRMPRRSRTMPYSERVRRPCRSGRDWAPGQFKRSGRPGTTRSFGFTQ